ncbi:putative transcription factor protein [Phaeoacremonium minimum UCRPA7]|uniref:Putative transcription factor protein n=1 Tax=Phaeoacremonium minimum (strain UCR-PA7) TaxID=1286976 RepID=R8BTN6_PHAM7|nr:putative transcription factor protein [Phaeoacremonium minimum UCRPA7]EOO02732.1 putative transcription factor protein [Phaeoacremonium minimum UCRPA7]
MAEPAASPVKPALTSTRLSTHSSPAIPVGLNEAAVDSPTFRSVAAHFADQVDAIERWLDGYVKSTSKVVHDILALEETINSFLSKNVPPPNAADGTLDPDYTVLALKRIGDGQREWWMSIISTMRRMDGISVEPIRAFLNGELRTFKEVRKALDQAQKTFDSTLARYVSQSKTKEPSSIREDAFAVYETRKAYLKASMDYCQLAPQLRFTLDKLLVRVSSEMWREMKRSRDAATSINKWGEEMERIRGWSKEMEGSEAAFKRELQIARRDIGENALALFKPSREIDDYSASTVPFLGSRGPMNVRPKDESAVISEKQGWLFLRTLTGKPVRANWVRRWYYCRDGIFGWLIQGPQGVLQGDEIGVLLCSAKPAVQEERRFCFEVKTKSQTLLLQAETQTQLVEWLEVFEVAKKQAFDASMGRDNASLPGGIDPAFAITPPSIPEFSAHLLGHHSLPYKRLDDDPFVTANTQAVPVSNEDNKSALSGHRKTVSVDVPHLSVPRIQEKPVAETFPPDYPIELKIQHAQFRLLFPNVPLEEKLVLVFNAAWTSTSEDGSSKNRGLAGNGRIYVTADNMYFYGQQMGLVVAYTLTLDIITEVTAAPGRDCDFIFLHLGQDMNNTGFTRITIKTFLEDLPLLHSRLNLLIDDLQAEEPMDVPEIITALKNLENDEYDKKSPSVESWEEVSSNTPIDDGTLSGRPVSRRLRDVSGRRSQRNLLKPAPKLQLPSHPVVYEPEGMQRKVEERHFELSAKACFHVLFGDKSFIFPKLYFERRAKEIAQGPWELGDQGKMKRQFKFVVDYVDMLGRAKPVNVTDTQSVDIFNDHITYVVTHVKTPWHLPHSQAFKLITKVVITHLAKSKCKLAIYTKVDWSKTPTFSKSIVERQALNDATRDAEELAEVATDQVRKLGPHSRTKRAIQVYGNIGQQAQVVVFTPGETEAAKKPQIKPRTLTEMLFETLRSFMESVVTSLIMWAVGGVRKFFSIVTANRIILLLLGFSIFTNVVFTGRQTSTWWSERRATRFMNRLGVGPNVMMSKAVYIRDFEEAAQGTSVSLLVPQQSHCYDTFIGVVNATDMDAPHEDAGSALTSATSRATARRIRRTRQRLGSYRHDLLVAMRIVNSIDQEMIQSEWENWLSDENTRCEQVKIMLTERRDDKEEANARRNSAPQQQKVMRPIDGKRIEELKQWHSEYCGSCRTDRDQLLAQRQNEMIA